MSKNKTVTLEHFKNKHNEKCEIEFVQNGRIVMVSIRNLEIVEDPPEIDFVVMSDDVLHELHSILEKWKKLELTVISYVEQNKKFDTDLESIVKSKIKTPKIILSRDKLPYRRKINALISVRNNIVHQIEPRVKEKTILKYIDEMDDIIKGLTLNKNILEHRN